MVKVIAFNMTGALCKSTAKWPSAQRAAWILTAIIFLLSPATASADLFEWDNGGVGTNYATADNWNLNAVPEADDDVQVNNLFTVTYDETTGDRSALTFFIGDRTSPYNTAVLNFSGDDTYTVGDFFLAYGNGTTNHSGATLDVTDDLSIGVEFSTNRSTTSLYNHTGGLVQVGNDLVIANQTAANTDPTTGTYQASSSAELSVNGRITTAFTTFADTFGNFQVTGSEATINAGSYAQTSRGTLTYVLDSAGGSTIEVAETAAPNGNGAVTLAGTLGVDLSSLAAEFSDNIVLIANDGVDAIGGAFGTIQGLGGTSWDGTYFSFDDLEFELSYTFDSQTNTNGSGNDLALVNMHPVPEPSSLALLGMGLLVFAPRVTRIMRSRVRS